MGPSLVARWTAALAAALICNAASADSPLPDVVRKKDGGMLRGTIEELDPKGTVTIVLSNGDRRTVAMSEVDYAGPNRAAPGPKTTDAMKPMVSVTAEESQLDLSSQQTDVTFHVKTGEAQVSGTGIGMTSRGTTTAVAYSGQVANFTRLCTAPCQAQLAAGSYVFALSMKDGGAVPAEAITVRGPVRLQGEYVSNQATRTAGIVIAIASVGLGTYLILTASKTSQDCSVGPAYCFSKTELDTTQLILGTTLATVGSLVGILMARKSDDAKLRILPGVATLRARGEIATASPVTGFQGASLRFSF